MATDDEAATDDPRPSERVDRARMLAAQEAAAAVYRAQLDLDEGVEAASFLTRIGVPLDGAWSVGFAPDRPTAVVNELRRRGFADSEILASGLGHIGPRGLPVDRFRKRVMVGVRAGPGRDAPVVGFVGYALPHLDPGLPARRYSPASAIFAPGITLVGLSEQPDRAGHQAILAGHPLDAIVVSERTAATESPPLVVAPASQRLTRGHVDALTNASDMSAGVGVTLRVDREGRRVAGQALRMLAPLVGADRVMAAGWSSGLEKARPLTAALGIEQAQGAPEGAPEGALEGAPEVATEAEQASPPSYEEVPLDIALAAPPAHHEEDAAASAHAATSVHAAAGAPTAVGAPAPRPGAKPVDGVDGYHYTSAGLQITVYGPDGTTVATGDYSGGIAAGEVDGVRIPGYGYGTSAFPLVAASQHRAARLPADRRDRAWVEVVPNDARAGRSVVLHGTVESDAGDARAREVGNLVWSDDRHAWTTAPNAAPKKVDVDFARLLEELARQGRVVLVTDASRERDATPSQTLESLTDEELLAACRKADAQIGHEAYRDEAAAARAESLKQEREDRVRRRITAAPAVTAMSDEELAAERGWLIGDFARSAFRYDSDQATLNARQRAVEGEGGIREARSLLAGPAPPELSDEDLRAALEQADPLQPQLAADPELPARVDEDLQANVEPELAEGSASPPDVADAGPFTPVELATIRIAVEDHAAHYYRGPLGPSRKSAERYVSEGHLGELCDRHGLGPVWEAVAAEIEKRPELLERSKDERAAAQPERRERAAAVDRDALDAFKAGDFDRADELIDAAELIDPDFGDWRRARLAIEEGRAQGLAGDSPARDGPEGTAAAVTAPDAGAGIDMF